MFGVRRTSGETKYYLPVDDGALEEGGMSTVLKAQKVMDNEDSEIDHITSGMQAREFVVIKTVAAKKDVKEEKDKYEKQREALQREVDILGFLSKRPDSNDKVVQLMHWGRYDNQPSIVLNYIEGLDLCALSLKSKLKIVDIKNIAKKLFSALEYIHGHGIIHGDIKPENILISGEGADLQLRLIDFGLSCASTMKSPPPMRGIITKIYAPPEWLNKIESEETRENRDASYDVWSATSSMVDSYCVTCIFGVSKGEIETVEAVLKNQVRVLNCKDPKGSLVRRWIREMGIENEDAENDVEAFFQFSMRGLQMEPSDRASVVEMLEDEFVKD